MKKSTKKEILSMLLAASAANFAAAGVYDEIVDPSKPIGIRSYDVGDYVQNGLISHFDGIRNAGADMPHDPSATAWADLARAGHVANFYTTTVDADKHSQTPCYDGRWTDSGYVFPGHVYARMDEDISPGLNFTVQLALGVDVTKQTTTYPTWAGLQEDNGFFTTGQGKTVEFKLDNHVGRRPFFKNWEGKYITGMSDALTNYCFQEATRASVIINESAKNRTITDKVLPSNKWSIGGAWNTGLGYDWAGPRYMVGEIKSARFYNRALTDEELALNRRIDEARFRGKYNVEVVSTVPGAEGAESVGIYDVNGHHDFTASGNATVDGVEYAAAGYALEIWDSANGAWGKLQEYPGTSYAYTNCEATAKVRLTWIWKPVRGLVKYDVTTYAQQGLVLNFDGISNQGVGQPHSTNAAVWANCGSANATATVTKLPVGDAGFWSARGYDFRGGEYALITPDMDLGDKVTVQVVSEVETPRQPKLQGSSSGTDQNTYPTFFGNPNDYFNIYTISQGRNLVLKADAVVGKRGQWNNWTGQFFNAFLDYDSVDLRADDAPPVWNQGTHNKALGLQSYRFGGNPVGTLDGDKARRCIIGTVFAVRAYDRVLTSYELARNRAVDLVRFYDAMPNAASSNGVMVVTGVPGIEGAESNGFYEVLGDAHTFSASGAEKVFGGKTYRIAGYVLERMNPATGNWELEQESTGLSYTYVPGANQLYRRLTWRVRVVHGLKKPSEYTAADYVQAGLISMFDGISNRGIGVPHDSGTLRWKDLARQDHYANFYTTTVDTDKHSETLCYDGEWTDSGYSLPGNVYARMDGEISPGLNFSVQLVLDVDVTEQTTANPTWAGLQGDNGFFTTGQGKTVEFKLDNHVGRRPFFKIWEGKYITGMSDALTNYCFQDATRASVIINESAKNRTITDKVLPSNKWSIGGAWNTGLGYDYAGPRYTIGEFKNARFYNRALTDEELAWNRKVDEVRFRGAVITNVVVSTTLPGASGNEPDGVYEVEGSWTFTASAQNVDGHKVIPAGYRLRRLVGGTWDGGEWLDGAAYTYDTSNESGPVMLVWQFARPGMVIVVK